MSTRRALALPLMLVVLLASGCGAPASNGDAAKPVAQILVDVKAAVAAARSVHVVGSVGSSGGTIRLDLELVAGVGGEGTIEVDGGRGRIVRLRALSYIEGNAAFWRHYGSATLSSRLAGRWISAAAASPEFSALRSYTGIPALYAELTSVTGGWRKQRMTTVDGVRAFTLIDRRGEVLSIAATGSPYPLVLRAGTGATGGFRFEGWNASEQIAAPRGATPYTRLRG